MNADYRAQIKGVVGELFKLGDELDKKGVGQCINKTGDGNLRESIKAEILLFIFKVLDPNKTLDDEEIGYINDCLEYNFTPLSFEIARRRASEEGIPQLSILLPGFIIIDDKLGGHTLSTTYVKTMSYVTIGLLNYNGKRASMQETVNYCRRITIYSDMIKKSLDCDFEFDPMEHIDEGNKSILEIAITVDEKLNVYEAENTYLKASVEAIKKTIEENKKESDDVSETTETVNYDTDSDTDKNNDTDAASENSEISNDNKPPAIDRLNQLIGLREVKNQIHTILNVQIVNKKCKEYKIKRRPIGKHMVFIGNPGTGKTTVARLVGEIYHEEGILSKGQFIEVSRADLVGKYVGHTAQMVKDVVKKAKGGVLFIDEAYTLTGESNDFGPEAISTLIKEMEDNREDLVVIAAGYPALMQEFMRSNPGLQSRFPITIEFPDYSADELMQIFNMFCKENSLSVNTAILWRVEAVFRNEVAKKRNNFGNARMVRNYFEKMIMNQADRLVDGNMLDRQNLTEFAFDDISNNGSSRDCSFNKNDFQMFNG